VATLPVIIALTLVAVAVPAHAQSPAKVYRVGWFTSGLSETDPRVCVRTVNPFRQAWNEVMRTRGYVEGQNLTIECRRTDGKMERAPAFAAELVKLKPDVIIAANTNQVRALKNATGTIPIVMYGVIDPVKRGLVASLARPGGNVTGLTDDAGMEILGRYLQLLTQAVPKATRVAVLRSPGALGDPALDWGSLLEAEARALRVTLQQYLVRSPEELEGVFAAMTKAQALLVVPSPLFGVHAKRIVDLVTHYRLPAMFHDREHVEAGGLMAYTVDERDVARRIAVYVDRVLKGANPGDLPVEQPTGLKLMLNLKTAKALGVTFPPEVLIQAEEVLR
jgi:putative ABC transport system substrate-binding protein